MDYTTRISPQSTEELAQLSEAQLELLRYRSRLLQYERELANRAKSAQQPEADTSKIESTDIELKHIELRIAELEQKIAIHERKLEITPPMLAFADPNGTELGTLRVIADYGILSPQSLDMKYPAGTKLIAPVHPLDSSATKAGRIEVVSLQYPPIDGNPEIVATHYYLVFRTRTYELAFFESQVSTDNQERIVLSLDEAQ